MLRPPPKLGTRPRAFLESDGERVGAVVSEYLLKWIGWCGAYRPEDPDDAQREARDREARMVRASSSHGSWLVPRWAPLSLS